MHGHPNIIWVFTQEIIDVTRNGRKQLPANIIWVFTQEIIDVTRKEENSSQFLNLNNNNDNTRILLHMVYVLLLLMMYVHTLYINGCYGIICTLCNRELGILISGVPLAH